MIDPVVGTIHYVQANKKGQRVGVQMGRKVVHFTTTLDEEFAVGDEVIVTMARREGGVLATE